MDTHVWKGKGLVSYVDSEDDEDTTIGSFERKDTFDPSSSNEQDLCSGDLECGFKEHGSDSDKVVPPTEVHDKNVLGGYAALTHSDVMEMKFTTVQEGESFYIAYAKHLGFSVRKQSLQKNVVGLPTVRVLVCQKEGHRDEQWTALTKRKRAPKADVRENCKAQLRLKYDTSKDIWFVTKFVMEHSHDLVPNQHVHFLTSHRKMDDATKMEIRSLVHGGLSTRSIIDLLGKQSGGYDKMGFTRIDVYNYINALKGLDCVDGDVKGIEEYFRAKQSVDKGFYFNHSLCDDNRLGNLLWADSMCQYDYFCFGEVISFDSAFKRNRYGRPLVVTTGVNHHNYTLFYILL